MLRFVSLLVLAFWIGGLGVLGFVAAPAGGGVLQRFHQLSWLLGGGLLLVLGLRAVLGPRPHKFGVQMGLTCIMLAASAASGVFHALSNGLMLVTLAAGAVMLWIETRDRAT